MNAGEGLRRVAMLCTWIGHSVVALGGFGIVVAASNSKTSTAGAVVLIALLVACVAVPAYALSYVIKGFAARS